MDRMMRPDRLRSILELVEESLEEPDVAGADLAARAYLSRFHFDRLVSSALGEPPGAFRRRLLLERAAHRLASTADAVIDVALDAGYGSPEAFARAFRRCYGASPTLFRAAPAPIELAAASGVHFHPPGGLRLPATRRSTEMDVLTGMVEHHLWLVGQIVERLDRVGDDALDRPIELSVEGIDRDPTLRALANKLVLQLEMWVSAVGGGTSVPADGDTSTAALRARLAAVAPRFRADVLGPVHDGRADETFVDASCDPPQTFTFGGVVAHVLTFAAARRTMAIGALESAGVADLGSGDPQQFVGGTGTDAAEISRRRD
jgi:AraC family transcriptional regulator